MKHCHFSIIYNEIAFLKQKLPFLYKHFHQIIFYDLNIKTMEFSNDGSHEFIKNFPDPQKKITLIEKNDLSDVGNYVGESFVEKRKMFAVGSMYVKDNIDVFWCTDADEFFDESFIKDVEVSINNGAAVVSSPHIIYYKNINNVFIDNNSEIIPFGLARVVKHNRGNLYGHCCLQDQYNPLARIDNLIHHFAYLGDKRIKFKSELYKNYTPAIESFYNNTWKNFNPDKSNGITKGIHPATGWGVAKRKTPLLKYINHEEMMKDLK